MKPSEPPNNADGDPTTAHVRRARDGDSRSVSWLVERFSPYLRAQASYRMPAALRRHYEIEDLLQDTWAITLFRLGDLEPRDGRLTQPLVRFLGTTLNQHLLTMLRQLNGGTLGRSSLTSRQWRELPAPTQRVVGVAVRREHLALLEAAIAGLAADQREVVVLRGIEGHAYETIGRLLGPKPESLRMLYHRGLERLRASLAGKGVNLDELTDDNAADC